MTPSPDLPELEIRARCAPYLTAAAEEARRLGHNYIGVEHLFMAMTRMEEGATAFMLRRAGLNPRTVRIEIRNEVGTGEGMFDDVLPITPRANMILSFAIFLADRDQLGDTGSEAGGENANADNIAPTIPLQRADENKSGLVPNPEYDAHSVHTMVGTDVLSRSERKEAGGLANQTPDLPRVAANDTIEEIDILLAILQEGESLPARKLIELGFDINGWLEELLAEEDEAQISRDWRALHDDLADAEDAMFGSNSFGADEPDFDIDEAVMHDLELFEAHAAAQSSPFQREERSRRRSSAKNGKMPTPLLDKYGRDLTAQAAEGKISPAIAREKEIRALARTLARSKKNNPLLLGDAGVGKTAVVEGLAHDIQAGVAPPSLKDRRIVQIEIGTLVAGTSLRGQFEERLIGIVDEAKSAGNIILFIDEIHTLVGAGDTIDSNLDAANILKPALARGEIVCIGATTHEEYRRAIAQDPALDRRFRPIDIEEPSEEDSLLILQDQKLRLEKHHQVVITTAALEAAVRLSVRYMAERRLPDKALDLLDEACARIVIRSFSPDEQGSDEVEPNAVDLAVADVQNAIVDPLLFPAAPDPSLDAIGLGVSESAELPRVNVGNTIGVKANVQAENGSAQAGEDDAGPPTSRPSTLSRVDVESVADVLSDWTGIPVSELTQDERRRLATINEQLHTRVIGQDDAVNAVASAVKTARAGLGDPNRPIGVFLFLGPSGVGKTEMARALAHFLFGSDDAMLRLDMSEFHDAHTVARLIGAPPGYRDAQRGGQLTDGLRRRPYSVVLLDEVEKAAPEVFDIFLQVFDEGRLSDAHGGVVDARHAVFIMTSNIGTEEQGRGFGFRGAGEYQPDYTAYLSRFFRPEFLNRLDDVVIFRPLSPEVLSAILDVQLADLHRRLAEQSLSLTLSDSARALILEQGFDPINGARPLRRAIERLLTRPLSSRIVEETFPRGTAIRAEAEGDHIRFRNLADLPPDGSGDPDVRPAPGKRDTHTHLPAYRDNATTGGGGNGGNDPGQTMPMRPARAGG